jgi:hypothetical protein
VPGTTPVTSDRFGDALGLVLTGFERVEGVDYAQSWLVTATGDRDRLGGGARGIA